MLFFICITVKNRLPVPLPLERGFDGVSDKNRCPVNATLYERSTASVKLYVPLCAPTHSGSLRLTLRHPLTDTSLRASASLAGSAGLVERQT